ncbi:GNAT family N-acetyltransferase [Cytobacillus sp. FJAT-54145]|uniref:GNAT family N-acetyltransferase n=1 Tax=Cytobacillus spartinae TaxID=3299023 RepID=A0ABW6KEN9_9BACI
MEIRNVRSEDYLPIISVVDDWWGGRSMADMLPKLFFDHFQSTSFIMEDSGEVAAFLIGFVSQSKTEEAYIHFVGVNPSFRKTGLGAKLYHHFFSKVKELQCDKVCCVTSPINKNSISFHTALGFEIEPSETKQDGVYIHKNYDGKGSDRVLFYKKLD